MRKKRQQKKQKHDIADTRLDWVEELYHYVAANGYKVHKKQIEDELFEYYVVDPKWKEIVLTITSARDVRFIKRKPRRRKRRHGT
jgi:hypothetical protein